MSDSHDKVGTNDTCPDCGKWMGLMHTCPVIETVSLQPTIDKQMERDVELQPKYHCEVCRDSRWYGDQGPGRMRNNEAIPCDQCPAAKEMI